MIRWPVRSAATAVALVASLASARATHAQPSAAAVELQADQAFDQGRALQKAGDQAGACAAFRASERLRPSAGAELNLAPCLEDEGQLFAAVAMLEQARARAQRAGDQLKFERAVVDLAALRARIPTIAVGAEGRPAAMTIDDVAIEDVAEPTAVEPGHHRVRVRWDGGPEDVRDVHVGVGERVVLAPRAAVPATAAAATQAIDPIRPARARGRPRRAPALIGAAGLALGAAGVATLLVAYDHDAEARAACPNPSMCDSVPLRNAATEANRLAVRDARIATGLFVGAGAALGVAAYLWLRPAGDGPRPAVVVAPGGAALSYGGSF